MPVQLPALASNYCRSWWICWHLALDLCGGGHGDCCWVSACLCALFVHWVKDYHVVRCCCGRSAILSGLARSWPCMEFHLLVGSARFGDELLSRRKKTAHQQFTVWFCHLGEFLSASVQSFSFFSSTLHWLVNVVKAFLAEDHLPKDSLPDFVHLHSTW